MFIFLLAIFLLVLATGFVAWLMAWFYVGIILAFAEVEKIKLGSPRKPYDF